MCRVVVFPLPNSDRSRGRFCDCLVRCQACVKQITLVSVQTAVALHGAMSARANLLSARADARLKKFADSLSLGYHEREGTAALTHWVWDMESITRDEVSFLQFQQMENLGGDEATAARTSLIRCLEVLAQSLWDFNREVHLGYSEGEIDITPELRAQVDVAERQAKLDLPARITAVLTRPVPCGRV
jgi:hypothetical protein